MRSENLMGPFQLASRFPSKSMPWMSILSHGRCTLFSICDMFDLLENEFFIQSDFSFLAAEFSEIFPIYWLK